MSWWSQVSETVMHGLQITVVGMALVFFTLGLVILSVVLLTRLPGLRAKDKPKTEREESVVRPAQSVASSQEVPNEELARVAAIALAVLRSRRRASPRPKKAAVESAWKRYGRANQLGL